MTRASLLAQLEAEQDDGWHSVSEPLPPHWGWAEVAALRHLIWHLDSPRKDRR